MDTLQYSISERNLYRLARTPFETCVILHKLSVPSPTIVYFVTLGRLYCKAGHISVLLHLTTSPHIKHYRAQRPKVIPIVLETLDG